MSETADTNDPVVAFAIAMACLKKITSLTPEQKLDQLEWMISRWAVGDKVFIGLMADEVEKYAPEAVSEVGGFKVVDYAIALNKTRESRKTNE